MKLLVGLSLLALTTAAYAQTGAVKVEVKQANGRYELRREGKPYFINGAGGGQFPERIKAYGGNSIRTWSTDDAPQVLAEANKNGLTVMLELDAARERHGFDYNNPQAVAAQLQKLRAEVMKYKDNPAVLFWGVGHELDLEYTNPKVWLRSGADREGRPVAIPGFIAASAKAQTKLTAPTKQGAYRLFVCAYDGHDNVATANIPFYVKGK